MSILPVCVCVGGGGEPLPVSWCREQLHIVLDLWLCSTGSQCEHTAIIQCKGYELRARVHREDLIRERRGRGSIVGVVGGCDLPE